MIRDHAVFAHSAFIMQLISYRDVKIVSITVRVGKCCHVFVIFDNVVVFFIGRLSFQPII